MKGERETESDSLPGEEARLSIQKENEVKGTNNTKII